MEHAAPRRIAIVGGGIIGAAIAYRLAGAGSGAEVTVLDSGAARATDASFGWINASFHQDAQHFRLRRAGMAAWERLTSELGLPVAQSGCLCWETEGAAFDAQHAALRALGYPVEEIGADTFAALEPAVARPPARCLKFPTEAAADSPRVARALLAGAEARGMRRVSGVRVTGFDHRGGQLRAVMTDAGAVPADAVVVAAGTGSAALMGQLDVPLPMLHRPALVLRTRPVAPVLSHILVSKIGELRQLPDGSLLMPTAIGHQGDASEALSHSAPEAAELALARLRGLLPSLDLDWAEVTLAQRPVPGDGLPAVGPVSPGVYLATMHSGITLAALMGELVAREVLTGESNATAHWLNSYRPQRFRT